MCWHPMNAAVTTADIEVCLTLGEQTGWTVQTMHIIPPIPIPLCIRGAPNAAAANASLDESATMSTRLISARSRYAGESASVCRGYRGEAVSAFTSWASTPYSVRSLVVWSTKRFSLSIRVLCLTASLNKDTPLIGPSRCQSSEAQWRAGRKELAVVHGRGFGKTSRF